MGAEMTSVALERVTYGTGFTRARAPRIYQRPRRAANLVQEPAINNSSLSHALGQLAHVHGASKQSMDQLSTLLTQIVEDRTAYATLSSDGNGGALAQWRAGRSYIALEIGLSERSFVYSDASGTLRENLANDDLDDLTRLRSALRAFTDFLDSANPRWRAQRESRGR